MLTSDHRISLNSRMQHQSSTKNALYLPFKSANERESDISTKMNALSMIQLRLFKQYPRILSSPRALLWNTLHDDSTRTSTFISQSSSFHHYSKPLQVPTSHLSNNRFHSTASSPISNDNHHSTTATIPTNTSNHQQPVFTPYPVIPKEDFGPNQEYSVIHTDRSLNLMSIPFQTVMKDLYHCFNHTYHAAHTIIIPGYVCAFF